MFVFFLPNTMTQPRGGFILKNSVNFVRNMKPRIYIYREGVYTRISILVNIADNIIPGSTGIFTPYYTFCCAISISTPCKSTRFLHETHLRAWSCKYIVKFKRESHVSSFFLPRSFREMRSGRDRARIF